MKLSRVVDDMVEYGRAKNALRLLKEKPRKVMGWALLYNNTDPGFVFKVVSEANQLAQEGKANKLGVLFKMDEDKRSYVPLVLAFNISPAYGINDVLYDYKHPNIYIGGRRYARQETRDLIETSASGGLILLEGSNHTLEDVNVRELRALLIGKG